MSFWKGVLQQAMATVIAGAGLYGAKVAWDKWRARPAPTPGAVSVPSAPLTGGLVVPPVYRIDDQQPVEGVRQVLP